MQEASLKLSRFFSQNSQNVVNPKSKPKHLPNFKLYPDSCWVPVLAFIDLPLGAKRKMCCKFTQPLKKPFATFGLLENSVKWTRLY